MNTRDFTPIAHTAADLSHVTTTPEQKTDAARYVRKHAGDLAEEWLAALGLEEA